MTYMKHQGQKLIGIHTLSGFKIVRYVLIVALLIAFLYYLGTEVTESNNFNQASIEAFIKRAGIFSWLAYLLLVILAVLGPITSSVIILIGGYLFNPFLVIGLNLLGEFIGASGNFFIGRKLGKKLLMKKFPKIKHMVEKYGDYLNSFNIFLLGLIPVGTSNLTGYVAGMSRMSFKKYISSWMVAIFFLNIAISFLGYSARIHSLPLTIAIVVIIIISLAVMKKYTGINKDV